MGAELEGAPRELNEDGIVGRITSAACPVQIQGTVDGWPFYFRLRGNASFTIARPGEDPVTLGWYRGLLPGEYADGGRFVVDNHDGWTPHSEAWTMLRKAVAHWRETRGAGWPYGATEGGGL